MNFPLCKLISDWVIFATVVNHIINIWYAGYLYATSVKGSVGDLDSA